MPQENTRLADRVKKALLSNLLLVLTFLGVVFGFLLGFSLRQIDLDESTIEVIKFPGDILMRMLKMLIIPLIVSSLVSGLAALDKSASGKMGSRAVIYYMTTTIIASTLGIVLVTLIHPGNSEITEASKKYGGTSEKFNTKKLTTMDSLMDLTRNMFPDNVVQACFQSTSTTYEMKDVKEKVKLTAAEYKNLTIESKLNNSTAKIPKYKIVQVKRRKKSVGYENGMNTLGLIVFSLAFGVVLGQLGDEAQIMVKFFVLMNEIVLRLVTLMMWYSPIGIAFLISGKIIAIKNLEKVAASLGMYMLTVITGLIIHAVFVLSLMYLVITRKNPLKFFIGMIQAWMTALGTASSSATLPITFKCLEQNLNIDPRVTRFVLPIGATINMDGTALYEAVAAIFVAQVKDRSLNLGNLVTISLTATAASIGAASIPGAGLITMLLVFNAVGLPTDEIILIISVDWLLDRLRTSINVLGDAYGAAIVHHLCQDDLLKKENMPPRLSIAIEKTEKPAIDNHNAPADEKHSMADEASPNSTA